MELLSAVVALIVGALLLFDPFAGALSLVLLMAACFLIDGVEISSEAERAAGSG